MKNIKEKQKGIYAEDIAAIMGIKVGKGPLEVYVEKTQDIREDINSKEAEYWSAKFVDIISKEFSVRTGKQIRRENVIKFNEKYPFMVVNKTRKIVGENSLLIFNEDNIFSYKEENKEEGLLECQHYMAVTGSKCCYLASLVGGRKFIYKEVLRDEDLINRIIDSEKYFWENYIEKRVPPILVK